MLRRIVVASLLTLVPLTSVSGAERVPPGMVRIAGGSYRPLYVSAHERITRVAPFAIDTVPVSSADFLRFVSQHTEWSRARVRADLVDASYLANVHAGRTRPITHVSWFAAEAYCRARGARLPTTLEWEYVARASEVDKDAAAQPAFRQRVLELAVSANPREFRIGSGFRNAWGVRDLHGGALEWTSDVHTLFQEPGTTSEHDERTMSCAAGVVESGDASDYAAYLRYAFRRSMEQRGTAANVGFRCAMS